MKTELIFTLLFLASSSNCKKYHRFILPTTSSELTIVPRVEMPMTMSNTVQSGLNFRLPIAIRFPSMMDLVEPVRNVLDATNAAANALNRLLASSSPPSVVTNSLPSLENTTRINSRISFYRSLETNFPEYGKICLLRAICEVAEIPVMAAPTGLIGEIVDLLLT